MLCAAQVVFLDSLDEAPGALQQLGDKHLAACQYKEAATCYDRALLALPQQHKPSQLLLSVLLNLSASHLQLQQPQRALLFAAAATVLSCHKNSKAYYRAAVALDQLLSLPSASSTSNGGRASTGDIIAAATELMTTSVLLTGNPAPAAKAQMLAALTNVAAANSARKTKTGSSSTADSRRRGSASKPVSSSGEWQVVCQVLSGAVAELSGCFTSSSSSSAASADASLSAAEQSKEAGNAAFKQGSFTTALQHYEKALSILQTSSLLEINPPVLSSRAKAWLEQPSRHSQQQACLDAFAAALLDPRQPAAFHTAAVALLQLDEAEGALAV